MTAAYFFEKIDHRTGGNSAEIMAHIRRVFSLQNRDLARVRYSAQKVAALVMATAELQQGACAAVCPGCTGVCCINRHAYHEHEDIVYLGALSAAMPSYRDGVPDTSPCQFLGECGCTISRHLRPHRCNSYFCSPMLEFLKNGPAVEYRKFVNGLELITRKREEMLQEFHTICSGSW